MTSPNPQCGRTFVHAPHDTTKGRCPGLFRLDPPPEPPLVIRMPRRKHGDPEIMNPEVLGGRGLLVLPHDMTWEPIKQPVASTFTDTATAPVDRDPWAGDGAGYDVRVLRAGIQAIAADALTREDYSTAAYAYSVLGGDPIAPRYDDDPEDERIYEAGDTDPDPADESCGATAYGVRFAACDLPAGHNSQHHAWYDAGHGPTEIIWDNLR